MLTVYTRATNTGSWVQQELRMDQWQVRDVLNGRTTATITILDPFGTQFFARGMNIKLEYDNGTSVEILFEGYITRAEESRLGLDGSREHVFDCADQHYLSDKRVVAKAYQNEVSGDIVQDLITDYLAGEGVTAGIIEPGSIIRELTFNYVSASAAIQELAERNGFWWAINPDKTLDFRQANSNLFEPITWDADIYTFDSTVLIFDETLIPQFVANEALAGSVATQRANDAYRNTQWIRGGRARTDQQVETQFGDGSRTSFTVGYPIAELPTIEVDTGSGFVAQDVGVAGFDTGKDWYFSFNSLAVVQDFSGTPLTATDRIRVTYFGLFDVLAKLVDNSEITNSGLIEGGTGIVEAVEDNKRLTTRDGALELGAELLDYYARAAFKVRFVMRGRKYTVGDFLRIQFPQGGVPNANVLVTETAWFSIAGELRTLVEMVSGPVNGTWEDYFRRLTTRLDRAAERAGGEIEVVTTVENFNKIWTEAERPNIFILNLPGSGLFPGVDTVPSFEPDERVLYMAWFDNTDEIARKPYTLQTGANTSTITTTTLLGVNDAVGTFTHLGWFGGHTASGIVGTGVLVDKQAFAFTKTNIEQIQVIKVDTKWS